MKKIELHEDTISQSDIADIGLLSINLGENEKTAWSSDTDITLVDELSKGQLTAILPKDFTDHQHGYLLLTAEDHEDALSQLIDMISVKNILIYVKDFKDGRVFSLIRQIRQINTTARIIVGGAFGLDQSNYFVKSGANGFVVADGKVATLMHTLNDLKSAHSRQSVSSLPMFR